MKIVMIMMLMMMMVMAMMMLSDDDMDDGCYDTMKVINHIFQCSSGIKRPLRTSSLKLLTFLTKKRRATLQQKNLQNI